MEILFICLGVALGVLITRVMQDRRVMSGYLEVNSDNPEKDIFTVKLGNLDDLYHKDYIWLRIDRSSDSTHK